MEASMKYTKAIVVVLGMSAFVSAAMPIGGEPVEAVQQSAGAPETDRDPIIGTWIRNASKSKYRPGAQPPKSHSRTFDYTRDGLILVTFESEDMQGTRAIAHWYMGLDGKPYPEYS